MNTVLHPPRSHTARRATDRFWYPLIGRLGFRSRATTRARCGKRVKLPARPPRCHNKRRICASASHVRDPQAYPLTLSDRNRGISARGNTICCSNQRAFGRRCCGDLTVGDVVQNNLLIIISTSDLERVTIGSRELVEADIEVIVLVALPVRS